MRLTETGVLMAGLGKPKSLSRVVDKRAVGTEESRAQDPVGVDIVRFHHERAAVVSDVELKKSFRPNPKKNLS